ncbi:hypothetical protein [Paractinoplanes lichenicola]|uniref:Major facilitator superfamily (MFS) profile domain-containing protein n=1 Tax=Paractinoplanes lichenicola TaxID=2802976 RepID=A0ABS1VNH5_9ACTN|nr:hypothetical protein [Actinoplanes lichenicola]MBL7256026.1 hypothetical protein [Actinoplanes lichenicola]
MQARIGADSTGAILIPGLIVAGLGVGCVLPANASAVLAEVPRERSGMAGGALNTFRQLGLAFGVAIFGTIFTDRIADGQGSPAGFADGLNATLLVASATALAAALLVLVLVRKHTAAPDAAQAPEPAELSAHAD